MQNRVVLTSKKILRYIFLFIVIPLITLLVLYVSYSIETTNKKVYDSCQKVLSVYTGQTKSALSSAEIFVSNIVSNNIAFQSIPSSGTQTMVYSHCYDLIGQSRMLMKISPILGAFAIYSQNYHFYYPSYQYNYPLEDQKKIKDYLSCATMSSDTQALASWRPFQLSDRVVLIYSMNYMNTSLSALLDLNELIDDIRLHSGLEGRLAFTDSAGNPYAFQPNAAAADAPASGPPIMEPVGDYDLQLVFYPEDYSFFRNLDLIQILLFALAIFIILLLPVCWYFLQKQFFRPLESLTKSIQKSDHGNLPIEVSEDSCVLEIRQLSASFNEMIGVIKDLKIISYEQQLEMQQAQLQYLQLQIRPHFYLNYMNILYSLAENKECTKMQEIILSLSQYIRYTFRDIYNMVPLSTELSMATGYVELHRQNSSCPAEIAVEVGENTAVLPIPPFSVLTFIENSIKHARTHGGPLRIEVSSSILKSEDGVYLNLSIQDNGGGFPKEQLALLNQTANVFYSSEHIGIPNIRHRLSLIYHDTYSLSFFNQEQSGCVELFIPVKESEETL
jgi:two-component system sensor histidine kinase YesM